MNHQLFANTGEDHLAIVADGEGSDDILLLDLLGVTFHGVVPESDSFVVGAGGNDVAMWAYLDIVNLVFVTNKPEGSHARLEVPDHNAAVSGTGDNLLKVWVECNFLDCIFVTLEGSLEGGVVGWLADICLEFGH